MNRSLLFTIFLILLIAQPAFSQLTDTELGANYNHNPEMIDISDLRRAGVQTVRSTPRLYEYLSGERIVETDIGLEKLIEAKESGYKVIFGFRMDFRKNNERLPAPGSARETEIFNIIRRSLQRLGPNGVDLFTLGNEFNLETEPEDLEFDEDNRIPLVTFLQRMLSEVIEPLYAQEDWIRPSVYLGSFPQLFRSTWQTNEGIIELLKLTESDDRIEGLAIHFHLDDFGQVDQIFNFVRQYIPDKPFIVTEFSMHRLNNSNKNERIGVNQAGIDWAGKYGYDPDDLVRDYYAHVNTNQVEPQEFAEFFDTRTWFEKDYLSTFRHFFNANKVLYATYPVLQQSAPSSFENGEPVWFLNPLLMQVSLKRNDLGLLSENPLCAKDFHDWSPLDSEITLDTDITGPTLLDQDRVLLYLPFDESVADFSGNDQAVSIDVAGTNSYEDGLFGKSFSFDQTAITAGTGDWWNSSQDFSISVWVRLDRSPAEAGSAFFVIHQKDGGADPGRVHLEILNSLNTPGTFTDGQRADALGYSTPVGEWVHLGYTVDRTKGEKRIYINGELNNVISASGVEFNSQPVSIGANKGQNGAWFLGEMDDLLITGEVLNEAQMSTLASNTVAETYQSAATVFTTSWSQGEPDKDRHAVIRNDFTITEGMQLTTNSLWVQEGATLTVESGATLIVNGALSNAGEIIVNSGGALVTYAGNSTGNVRIKKNIIDSENGSLIGSPVLSAKQGRSSGAFIRSYDETAGFGEDQGASKWQDAGAAFLLPGHGFLIDGSSEIDFAGTPNDGTITVDNLSKTPEGNSDPDHQGWHLISNPYPALLSADQFLTDNDLSGIYVWEPGSKAFITSNSLGTVGPGIGLFDGTINVAEGFFIQVPTHDFTVNFMENQRITGDMEETSPEGARIKLFLEGNFYDETLLGFTPEATDQPDQGWDATKFYANDHLSFYSFARETKLAIQALPEVDEQEKRIKMGFRLDESGSYSLGHAEFSELDGYHLFAVLEEEIYNITSSPATLSLDAGTHEFVLVLSQSESIVANSAPEISDQVFTLPENSELESIAGIIAASDLEGSSLTYAINEGNEAGNFQINQTTGELSVAENADLDFESDPVFSLKVSVSDGDLSSSASVIVNLTDVNEAPVATDQTFNVDERSANGIIVGVIVADDPESDELWYQFEDGKASEVFAINSSSGELTVADNTLLDFDLNPSFELSLVVGDGEFVTSFIVTVNLNDLKEVLSVTKQQEFLIFPNPTGGNVSIEGRKSIRQIRIFGITGKMVLEAGAGSDSISLADQPDGIYLLEIIHENGTRELHKILKK